MNFVTRSACVRTAALALGLALPLRATAQAITAPTALSETDVTVPEGGPTPAEPWIALVVTVAADGSVSDASLEAPGDPQLDRAALTAIRSWTFAPARRDGAPVAARVRVHVRVVARTDPPPDAPARAPAPAEAQSAANLPPPVAVEPPAPAANAASPPPPAVPPIDPTPAAAPPVEVVVRGRATPPSVGAADLRLQVGELARVPRQRSSEMLTLAPGVYLTNEGGEGHADRVYLRGFDAREGQDIEFSIDGVPVNESGNLHGNGYADLNFIIPELVRELRVVEGPFDPRQGNYAVAGSADYQTGLGPRGLSAKYSRGSFGSERALLLFGPVAASAATYAGVELFKTDGFGQNRDARRARAMGQYEGALGEQGSYRLSAVAYGNEYHSAGVLREDDVKSGRKGFFDTYDTRQGGGGSRFHVAFDLEQRSDDELFHQQVFIIRRSLRLRENLTGALLDPQTAVQSLHGQRGDLLDLHVDETTVGARGFARASRRLLGQPQDLELGYFARGDVTDSTQNRVETSSGAPYKTDVDLGANLGDIGLYADATLRPWRGVSVKLGTRADLFWFDVLDRCAVKSVSRPSPSNPPGNGSCLDQQRFGAYREPEQRSSTASSRVMPRATVSVGPFAHLTASLSYGSGVRSIDPIYVTQDVATPFAAVTAWDAGVAYGHELGAISLAARSSLFRTHVDRDLIFSETVGRSVLGGGTTRIGASGLVRVRGSFFDQSANLALTRSTFDDTGLDVPYAPSSVLRADSALFGDLPFRLDGFAPRAALGLGLGFVGRRALPYGQKSDTLFTLDASGSLGFRWFELSLEATNLLDRRSKAAEFNYVSDFDSAPAPTLVATRHFAAAAPRQVLVSLSINLGQP